MFSKIKAPPQRVRAYSLFQEEKQPTGKRKLTNLDALVILHLVLASSNKSVLTLENKIVTDVCKLGSAIPGGFYCGGFCVVSYICRSFQIQ